MAVQSVSASGTGLEDVYANGFNLDDSHDLSFDSLSDSLSSSLSDSYADDLELDCDGGKEVLLSNGNAESSIEDNGNDAVDVFGSLNPEDSNLDSVSLSGEDSNLDSGSINGEDSNLDSGSENDNGDNRNSTKISCEPLTITYGHSNQLKIILRDLNNLGLSNKAIAINIDGNANDLITDDEGVVLFNFSASAGLHDIMISFVGDELYAPAAFTAKVNLTKSKTELSAPDVRSYLTCSTYVTARLKDSKGNALANKTVIFSFSGKNYPVSTDSKGIAKLKIPTAVGTYYVSAKFAGDENYSASSDSSKVIVTKMKTHIHSPYVLSYLTRSTYLKVTLKNIYGVPLANKKVSIKIGKRTYTKTTDGKGIAKLKFSSKIRTVKCTICFKGSNTFFAASNSSKVTIRKMPTLIKAPKVTFKSTSYGRLKINLTDLDGKALGKRKLTVYIPALKKSYRINTNSKGIAVFKFNGPRSYDVTIKYAGDKKHAAKTVKTQLVVKKVKVKLSDVIGVAKLLKEHITEHKSLPSGIEYKGYNFTTPQLSYLMAVAIKNIHNKNRNDIVLIATSSPKSSGEIYDTVYRKDYLKIANKAAGSSVNHKTKGHINYLIYKVPYKVYTASFSRILSFYKENKKLPNYSLFTSSEYAKVSNSSKYTFYLTTDNIAGKKTDLKMLKQLKKALKSKGYNAVIVGIGPDIHNVAYRYGCTGKNSVLLCCFGGVDVGCIEEWTGELSVNSRTFIDNYDGAHVLGLWYSKPYGASASLHKSVGRAWDADYGFALKNPAKYMSSHKISYIRTGTVKGACSLLKAGKMGGPKLIK